MKRKLILIVLALILTGFLRVPDVAAQYIQRTPSPPVTWTPTRTPSPPATMTPTRTPQPPPTQAGARR